MISNFSLQTDLVNKHWIIIVTRPKRQQKKKEIVGKWSAQCEALRNNLKAAARNADQEQNIEVLKQELADLKVEAAKKDETIKQMDKTNDQFRSELEQLEDYNQFLAN